MANYVYNKIICSKKFFDEYFYNEERDMILLDKEGSYIYRGFGHKYKEISEDLVEVKFASKWDYPIDVIVEAINIDHSIKWYAIEENCVYISKFEYDEKRSKVKESIVILDSNFDDFLGKLLNADLKVELEDADDLIWYCKLNLFNNWIEWETKTDKELIERYTNERYPTDEAYSYCEKVSQEILNDKVKRLVSRYQDMLDIKGDKDKTYYTRINLNPNITEKLTKNMSCICKDKDDEYNFIQVLPYRFNFSYKYDPIKLKNELIENDPFIYEIINGKSINKKSGNVYIDNITYGIRAPKIKQFVLCRNKCNGPLWKGEMYNRFEFYKFKNDLIELQIPMKAIYPSPEDKIEILEDDDPVFKDISDDFEKEIMIGDYIYMGVTKAFRNFLMQIGLIDFDINKF